MAGRLNQNQDSSSIEVVPKRGQSVRRWSKLSKYAIKRLPWKKMSLVGVSLLYAEPSSRYFKGFLHENKARTLQRREFERRLTNA